MKNVANVGVNGPCCLSGRMGAVFLLIPHMFLIFGIPFADDFLLEVINYVGVVGSFSLLCFPNYLVA